jgi:hypothetical protein
MNGTPGQYDYLLNEKTGIQSIYFLCSGNILSQMADDRLRDCGAGEK